MGKHLQHEGSGISIEGNHPGCMWGILHSLHHHRWHHVRKKLLPHKRHGVGRHVMGVGNPGHNKNATNAGEMQEHIDAEMNASLIGEKTTEPIPVTKSSMKSRIKALIAEEMSKRRGRHRRSSTFPTRMQLTRTDSIHHLQASEFSPHTEVASNDDSPRVVHEDSEKTYVVPALDPLQSKTCEEPVTSNKKCELCAAMFNLNYMGNSSFSDHGKQLVESDTIFQDKSNNAMQELLAQRLINIKEYNKDVSFHESKQFLDALDIFNMSKELFLKILEDPSPPLEHYFHGRRPFNSKIGFTKSMSFPLAGLSDKRSFGPSKIKHDQVTESCAKREGKTQVSSQDERLAELESTEDISETSGNTSINLPPVLKNQQENKVVTKHFKNLKQKIKQAIREGRKERHRITMDAVLHKIPYGCKLSKNVREEIVDLWKETTMDKCSKYSTRSSCENGGTQHMRRTSSFDESLDRYRQLYESSFNTESKHHISGRVMLRTEETPSPCKTTQKTLGRILSLPDLRAYYYLQSDDSPDITSSGTPIKTDVNNSESIARSRFDERKTSCFPVGSENEILTDFSVESGSKKNSVEIDDLNIVAEDEVGLRLLPNKEADGKVGFTLDDLDNLITSESNAQHENEIQATRSLTGKLAEPSPISVLYSSQEDMTSPTKFYLSEDSSPETMSIFYDEAELLNCLANPQCEASKDFPSLAESRVNTEKRESSIDQLNSEFLRVLVNTKDVAEFNYVKYVLELSGFSGNELLGTWHSPYQPVNPSVFEEVEGGNGNHMLLFDLINEVLLEIYERTFTYWSMSLSSTSYIRSAPVGYHVLQVVWENISWYLSWRPEADPSLDDAVTRDLAKSDGWMNLQLEAECVGLELEDMIFDDLLEELVWT